MRGQLPCDSVCDALTGLTHVSCIDLFVYIIYLKKTKKKIMAMRTPEELSNLIKDLIEEYTPEVKMVDFGIVFQVGDGIARIYGLERVMSGELLEFEDGTLGIALNLEANNVGGVLLGDGLKITEGSRVRCTGRIAEIPVGEAYLGRVVNSLAQPVDGKGPINTTDSRAIEAAAPGIVSRRSVYEPLQTGLVSVDSMIPVGRGQCWPFQ